MSTDNDRADAKSASPSGLLSAGGATVARLFPRAFRKARNLFKTGRLNPLAVAAMILGTGCIGFVASGETGNRSLLLSNVASGFGFKTRALIVNGNDAVDQQGIEFALTSQLQNSIFAFDTALARDALLKNPWFKSATLRKVYPDTVVVDVVERKPFAFWKSSDVVTVIARDGVVLGEVSSEPLRLPQVVGQGANLAASEFISVISRFPTIGNRASGFVRVADRRWDIVLHDGPKILLPEDNWKEAIAELDAMQSDKGILDRELVQIDLRLPDRFVFRLDPAYADERRERLENLLERKWHRT
ncbi:MAG: FtsQ-type POTRA domain-containing protein [Pseudomonadota bacterium]